jgi:phage/plasmid primase-like uncharacterized protein
MIKPVPMAYKTYTEQLIEHLHHLQSHGFDVTELQIDAGWIRCHLIGASHGRGELAYTTTTEKLNNGLFGIKTSFRGQNGYGKHTTYGQWPNGSDQVPTVSITSSQVAILQEDDELHKQAARKAYGFWSNSSETGVSDYLNLKGVGCHRIRFRSSEQYGNVAVIPMFDIERRLWSYQLLNPNGTKRYSTNGRIEGLFHMLRLPSKGEIIGIAESYVTAATCMELFGIPVACAFGCHNLKAVTLDLRKLYPESKLIIFADNDRHLPNGNQGVLKAMEAKEVTGVGVCIATPDFGDIEPSKEASDWNDLMRLKGREMAKAQILKIIHDGCICIDTAEIGCSEDYEHERFCRNTLLS